MPRVIARIALVALRFFGTTFHEPFHADSGHHPMAAIERSCQEQLPQHRDLPGSDRTVDQVFSLLNRTVLGINAVPLHAPAALRAWGTRTAGRANDATGLLDQGFHSARSFASRSVTSRTS